MMNRFGRIKLLATIAITALLSTAPMFADEPPQKESDLIKTLKSDADWQQKQAACRALRQIGTEDSIDALASQLEDPKMSHLARYALEPMPYPKVDKALRKALKKTDGMVKAGIISSLGTRRDPRAVSLLIPVMRGSDETTSRAAIAALGRIASPAAVKALSQGMEAAHPAMRAAHAEALLAAGQHLTDDGKCGAADIYQELMRAPEEFVRMGAFRGLAFAQPCAAPERLLHALRGDDPAMRDLAAQLVTETASVESLKTYTAAMQGLPPAGQVALIRGLAARKDPAARPAVIEAFNSKDAGVKLAAVKAFTHVGTAADVPALIKLLEGDPETSGIALATLTDIADDQVDAAIAGALNSAPANVRPQLMDLLVLRQAPQAIPMALDALKTKDAPLRIAALRVVATAGTGEQVPDAIAAILNPADATERPAAEKALSAVCARAGSKALPAMFGAIDKSGGETRISLMRGLAQIPTPESLQKVVVAVNDADAQVADEAVRLLSGWPNANAIPHLRALAQDSDLTRQVLATRGYIRLAQTEPALDKKTAMLDEAKDMAKRPDEMRLLVAAWGSVRDATAFAALQPYFDKPETQNEAALAMLAVAEYLADLPQTRDLAFKYLNLIIKSADQSIKAKAREMLTRHQ